MSINFYSDLAGKDLLTSMDLKSIMSYAIINGTDYDIQEGATYFFMTWKRFQDMVREHTGSENQREKIKFLRIIDTYGQKVFIKVSQQDKPYLFTESSGTTTIIDDIAQIQDETPIKIGFIQMDYADPTVHPMNAIPAVEHMVPITTDQSHRRWIHLTLLVIAAILIVLVYKYY